jgi:acyl-coenzyme A thioesterase PaaI-like protein
VDKTQENNHCQLCNFLMNFEPLRLSKRAARAHLSKENSKADSIMIKNISEALYYPFSRPIDLPSLKQMLLVFDTVAFLDPIDDDSWRAKLFEDLVHAEDKRFGAYQHVHSNLRLLFEEGAARRVDPAEIPAIQQPITAASALSDLLDQGWTSTASNPQRFGLPSGVIGTGGGATWRTFLPKMPSAFVDALCSNEPFSSHLIQEGGDRSAWTLSYAAGSAVSISVHLAAAEELGFAPVTDSAMHHELLIQKLIRNRNYTDHRARTIDGGVSVQLANSAMTTLINELLPREFLQNLDVEQMLRFREATKKLRNEATRELTSRLAVLSKVPSSEDLIAAGGELQNQVRSDLRKYQAELAAVRNKLWPTLVGTLNTNLAAGGVAAVAMNFIGGPGYALAASVLAGSLSLIKGSLDLSIEKKKLEASQSPAVSYLARVGALR